MLRMIGGRRRRAECDLLRRWLGVVGLALCTTAVSAETQPLVMGILPRTSATEIATSFEPLAAYLSARLGRPVRVETARDMDSFMGRIKRQQFDLVHLNQLQYLRSRGPNGYEVILKSEEFGRSSIAGAIAVRADSPVRSLADLKGRRVVFGGGPTAMVAHIEPKALLLRAGLKPGDYQEIVAPNPANALLAVYRGQADAAGIGDVLLNMPSTRERVDVSRIRLLAVGHPLPQLPWAVRRGMDAAQRDRIRAALTGLRDSPEGRKILTAAGLTDLVSATDAEYQPLQRTVDLVLGRQGETSRAR